MDKLADEYHKKTALCIFFCNSEGFLSLCKLQPRIFISITMKIHIINVLTWSSMCSDDMVKCPRLATVRAVWASMRLMSVAGGVRNMTRGTHNCPAPSPGPTFRAARGNGDINQ